MIVAERISNGWAYFKLCYQKGYGFLTWIRDIRGRVVEDHDDSVDVEYQELATEEESPGPKKVIQIYKPNPYRFW